MIFAKLPSGRHPESRWAWLKSRAEINGIIAVLAGILVYGGVQLIGLTVNHEMRIFILIILTSLVFMSMVTTLTTWNSRIGAFFLTYFAFTTVSIKCRYLSTCFDK